MKTIKIFIEIAILLISTSKSSLSQEYLHTYSSFIGEGTSVIRVGSDNIVGGSRNDSALIMRVNDSGVVIWSKCIKPFPSNNVFYIISLELTSDNYIIGTGGSLESNFVPNQGFYFKVSVDGNFQFCNILSGVNYRFTARRMLQLSNSTYMLMAAHEPISGTYNDPVLIKVDALNGNILSQSDKYDYQNSFIDDVSESILSMNKSVIYSTGRLYVAGAAIDQMRIFFTKFDTSGNHIWTKYFIGDENFTCRMYGSCILQDNDSIVIVYFGDNDGTTTNFEIGIIKCDTFGNMKWSRNYNFQNSTLERGFRIYNAANEYFISGYCSQASYNRLFLLSISKQGSVLWNKYYGINNQHVYNVNYSASLPGYFSNDYFMFTGATLQPDKTLITLRVTDDGLINSNCVETGNINVITTTNPSFTGNRIITTYPSNFSTLSLSPINTTISNPCELADFSLGNDTAVCSDFVLNAINSNVANYLWSDGSTNSSIVVSPGNTYSITVSNDCCQKIDTITINTAINTLDTTTYSICQFDTIALSVACPNCTYTWLPSQYLSCSNCISPFAFPPMNTTYTFIAQNDYCIDTGFVFVSVTPASIIQLNITDTSICLGNSFSIIASGATTYNWQPITGLNQTSGDIVVCTPSTNTTYVVNSSQSCVVGDTLIVTAFSPTSYTLQNLSICLTDSVLFNQPSNSTILNISPSQFVSCNNCDSIILFPPVSTEFTIQLLDTNGCSYTGSFYVFVNEGFVDAGNDVAINTGQSTQLNASGAAFYNWNFNESLSDTSIYNPIASPFSTTTYYVTGIDDFGCTASDSVVVRLLSICDGVFIPSAFSPNGDGINDVLTPIIVSNLTLMEFSIYNRWGQQVFTTNHPKVGWTGNRINNASFDIGTYVYIIKYRCNGKDHLISGNVTLLR